MLKKPTVVHQSLRLNQRSPLVHHSIGGTHREEEKSSKNRFVDMDELKETTCTQVQRTITRLSPCECTLQGNFQLLLEKRNRRLFTTTDTKSWHRAKMRIDGLRAAAATAGVRDAAASKSNQARDRNRAVTNRSPRVFSRPSFTAQYWRCRPLNGHVTISHGDQSS